VQPSTELDLECTFVLINDIKDLSLQLVFKPSYERLSDLRKKFLEASSHFHELSYIREVVIEHGDLVCVLIRATPSPLFFVFVVLELSSILLTQLLFCVSHQCGSATVVCDVLAPAEPQCSRNATTLYKDDRSQRPSPPSISEKMHLDWVLGNIEVSMLAH